MGRRILWHRHHPLVNGQDDKCENYCEEETAFHQLRDRIEARAAKRVAAKHTFETHPSAAEHPVGGNRLRRIFRTRRQVAT